MTRALVALPAIVLALFASPVDASTETVTLSAAVPFVEFSIGAGHLDAIAHSDAPCNAAERVDPFLFLVDPDGRVIAGDDDGAHDPQADCFAARMTREVPGEGYLLRVTGCCGHPFGTVRLERLAVPTTTTSTTSTTTTTTTTTSTTTTTTTTTSTTSTTTTLPPTTTTEPVRETVPVTTEPSTTTSTSSTSTTTEPPAVVEATTTTSTTSTTTTLPPVDPAPAPEPARQVRKNEPATHEQRRAVASLTVTVILPAIAAQAARKERK